MEGEGGGGRFLEEVERDVRRENSEKWELKEEWSMRRRKIWEEEKDSTHLFLLPLVFHLQFHLHFKIALRLLAPTKTYFHPSENSRPVQSSANQANQESGVQKEEHGNTSHWQSSIRTVSQWPGSHFIHSRLTRPIEIFDTSVMALKNSAIHIHL